MAEVKAKRVTLETPRLTLRPAFSGDLDDFYLMFSNEDVMRYWSCAPHTSPAQTKGYLDSMIDSPTNGTLDFVLVLNSPDRLSPDGCQTIGKVGIWSAEKQEIGLMLSRDYWGKGLMAEAMTALFPHLWKRGVKKVVADVDPRNESSIRILKKFGFVETGREGRTGEVGGVWYDSVYLALEG